MLKGGVVVLAMLFAAVAHAVDNPFPRAADAYLVKRDGRIIWAAGADERHAPASLTKMMTALLVLERGQLEEPVVVSRAAAREKGSRIGLRAGDQMRTRDLLAAAVMHSANDACRALADHVGGPLFVSKMNQRALALGMKNTQFADPCGWDKPGHYSTAADLARLAEKVMQYPEYERLSRMRGTQIRTVDGRRSFHLRNTNFLVGRYDGLVAGKTGTTGAAGYCLVVAAERNGARVMVVLLNSPRRWSFAPRLMDRAFALQM